MKWLEVIKLRSTLKEFGLVDHTLWIEEDWQRKPKAAG